MQKPSADDGSDTLPPVLSLTQLPLIAPLGGRDIFKLPGETEADNQRLPLSPHPEEPQPILSSIVWGDTEPLAVIDGEILGLGETDAQSRFRVETITPNYVQIRRIEGKKMLRLTLTVNQTDE